mgnify:FL=1
MSSRSISHSESIVCSYILPEQANPAGNAHGGEIMKLMDSTGGVVCRRHCHSNVVTARVDKIDFLHPIRIGNLVTCHGKLTFVGKSSMEVFIRVTVEDLSREAPPIDALTGYFTYVALDDNGKPQPVPALNLVTEEERHLFEEGRQRYLATKKR